MLSYSEAEGQLSIIHCFKSNVFSVYITRYLVRICYSFEQLRFQNRLLEAATFLEQPHLWSCYFFERKCFLWRPGSLKQLLLSNDYFLVTSTFPDFKYFFSTATALEELLPQSKSLFITYTFSKQDFLLSGNFFRWSTFLKSQFFLLLLLF